MASYFVFATVSFEKKLLVRLGEVLAISWQEDMYGINVPQWPGLYKYPFGSSIWLVSLGRCAILNEEDFPSSILSYVGLLTGKCSLIGLSVL